MRALFSTYQEALDESIRIGQLIRDRESDNTILWEVPLEEINGYSISYRDDMQGTFQIMENRVLVRDKILEWEMQKIRQAFINFRDATTSEERQQVEDTLTEQLRTVLDRIL